MAAALLFVPALALGHGEAPYGSFRDIGGILAGCTAGCHEPDGTNPMWFNADGGGAYDWDEAYIALLGSGQGALPANDAAKLLLKRRVDPKRPWNSFLLDKLTGKLKNGEGVHMPYNQTQPLFATDPKKTKKIETWIAGGAPLGSYVPGDPCWDPADPDSPAYVGCEFDFNLTQPTTPVVSPPATGFQIGAGPWTLGNDHEEERCFLLRASGASGYATRIDAVASAGTSYLTISRSSDQTTPAGAVSCSTADEEPPFLVVRSRASDPTNATRDPSTGKFPLRTWVPQPGSETIVFPAGVGLTVGSGQAFLVRQRVRADFPVKPSPTAVWKMGASGDFTVSFETAAGDHTPARVIYERRISDLTSFVPPPRGIGVSGNAWTAERAVHVVALSVLADKHVRPAPQGGASVQVTRGNESVYSSDAGERATYRLDPFDLAAGDALVVRCEHDNGDSRPLRYGCQDRVQGLTGPPSGTPLQPAAWCDEDGLPSQGKDDCPGASAACGWANLTAGPGEDDARCTLVGLYYE